MALYLTAAIKILMKGIILLCGYIEANEIRINVFYRHIKAL